jgi:hypothetical protein
MAEIITNEANKSHLDFRRTVANSPPGTQRAPFGYCALRNIN